MLHFSIISAVKNAYLFVGKEWRYLLKLSLLPMGVSALTQFLIFNSARPMSAFELYAWALPSNILMGWFMFAEARLMLMGERADALPQNEEYLTARKAALQISVLVWLLFNLCWSAMLGYQEWVAIEQKNGSQETWPIAIGAVVVGGFFWGLRFGVAHILAAVDYPVRGFIRQVDGLGISLKFAGLALLSCLPVLAGFLFIAQLVFPDVQSVNDPVLRLAALLGGPLSLTVCAVMNAAGVYAVREILGKNA